MNAIVTDTTTASSPNGDKKLVIEFLLAMHAEQSTHFLHRETQRSTATNMFIAIATATLALIAYRWVPGEGLDRGILPLTVGLLLFSAGGFFLSMKLFERSQVNFVHAQAYRNVLEEILRVEASKYVESERFHELDYVKKVDEFLKDPNERKPYRVSFKLNTKRFISVSPEEYNGIIARHNPINPREVIEPRQNAVARWFGIPWVWFDTHKCWAAIHLTYGFVAAILTLVALID